MRVEVRLFGGLTELAGTSRLAVDLGDDATVADLRQAVADAHPALGPLLDRSHVAVDLEVATTERVLAGAREVALLPPVAGGAGDDPVGEGGRPAARTREGVRLLTGLLAPPLDVAGTMAALAGSEVGATAVFLGTVRDHAPDLGAVVRLDYSAYREMAERVLGEIADEIAEEHPAVRGVALLHTVGELDVGEHTVLIVCSAAHRGPAFAACQEALERVKTRVPIWKREHTAEGTHRWVGL